MKLYQVYNGFTGYSDVHVLVVAENEDRANELASEEFKAKARNESYDPQSIFPSRKEEFKYSESYWTNLDVCLIQDDLTIESVGEVSE